MSDWSCKICRIEKIIKHPFADTLSIATVLGDYPVIVKSGLYKIEDLVAYLSIDTIFPDTKNFYFLTPKKYEKYEENNEIKRRQNGFKYPLGSVPENYRIIKSKKIFNIYSQGLIMPISDLPTKNYVNGDIIYNNSISENLFSVPWEIGDSVVEALNLSKWEEEEEDNLPIIKSKGKNAGPTPKGWSIPHYDIASIRNYLKLIENEQDIILTEKIHGSNFSASHDGTDLWIKSRNYYKKKDSEDDPWVEIASRYNLEQKLAKYPNLAFFAELTGNIKNFRYSATIEGGKLLTKLYFFDIYDTQTCRYLDYDRFKEIITDLELESTPVIYRGPWTNKEEMYALGERKTALGNHIAEGWVLSLAKERYEPKLNGRVKLKYISEQYNLQK